MVKKTKTASGLALTPTGILQFPKEFCSYDKDNGWNINNDEPNPGDRIWKWSHNRTMSKKSVGTVISAKTEFEFCRILMKNLDGDEIEIYENMILTEDQFQDAKNILS